MTAPETTDRNPPTERVVLVDDDAEGLPELKELFEYMGIHAATYSCPLQARDRVLRDPAIEVMVTDFRMSMLDGQELIQSIRSRLPAGRHVSFAILTGLVLPNGHTILGDVPCYCKPMEIEEMTDFVRSKLNI